jgi:hypothetical protein
MAKIPTHVLNFAGASNTGVYEMFVDYWKHYLANQGAKGVEYQKTSKTADGQLVELSFAQKEDKMNQALKREILRVAGVPTFEGLPLETWANNPNVQWATFAVISSMIDMILPDSILTSTADYADVRNIGWGDSALFEVEPRDIFVVSKHGRNRRMTEIHRQLKGNITVLPELRALTVGVTLYAVLAGKESLAALTAKMVRSFESALVFDIYDAFATAMAALPTGATGLRVAGYTQDEFVRLSQTVAAWSGGQRAIALGTQLALSKIMPEDANYRYMLDSDYVKLGYIRNFMGTDLVMLPQLADWTNPFATKLSDDKIWIIAPSSQKLIKVVVEGNTLSRTDGQWDSANLQITTTMFKSWGTALATNGVAAEITLP